MPNEKTPMEEFNVYEFRPLNKEGRKLLRYNNGNWIDDDGEYDLAFITDDIGAPMCYYISLPYRSNLLWSWCKDMNWTAYVPKHPNGNAWHYMSKDGSNDISETWYGRDKHPNISAGSDGMDKLSKKHGCANGSGVNFYANDPHIVKGLVRFFETKKTVKTPKMFECIYCGSHDLEKSDSIIRSTNKKR